MVTSLERKRRKWEGCAPRAAIKRAIFDDVIDMSHHIEWCEINISDSAT